MMIKVDVINECTNKKLPFPDVIRHLSEIDIERYYTDLVRMEKTYYSHSGESYVEHISIKNLPVLASGFDEVKVIEAIRASQKGLIDYHTFIKNIIAAGTVSYTVYIDGKQVIYEGRKGESHIENFHFK
jgi:uncharacterized protein YbcV (DUF1398 family)